jgi:hypothetical protein
MRVQGIITASIVLIASCNVIIEIPTDDSGGDESTGRNDNDSSADEESSGPGATSTTGGNVSSDSSGTDSTGEVQCDIVLDEPLEIEGDRAITPCYTDETFACTTCTEWCETFGTSCRFVHTTNTGMCEPYGDGINQLGLCDVDIFSTFPTESLEGLVIRCVCDAP